MSSDNQWHYANGSDSGPVAFTVMIEMYQIGTICDTTYIWHPSECPNWTFLKDLPALKTKLAPKPAAPAPPPAPPRPPVAPPVQQRPTVVARHNSRERMPGPGEPLSPVACAAAKASAMRRKSSSQVLNNAHQSLKNLGAKGKSVLASAGLISSGPGWMERRTADGVPYYHNVSTGALSWDKPDELKDSSELQQDAGNWVWFPDSQLGYVPALLVQTKPDGRSVVQLENGQQATSARGTSVYPLSRSALARTERDLTLLDSLDEGLILYNLRERFEKQNQIYTWIGNILISINPYETYPIYGTSNVFMYKNRGNRVLDPHVYVVADDALKPLLEYGENHSILISGESGAGKTWNCKQTLSYLTEVTKKSSKKGDDGGRVRVEEQILAANPILEAFGNAKTVRNDNSSRFGRFTEVHFRDTGKIDGARIENFLLEKSRVVWQQSGERNYHIFYQLMSSSRVNEFGLQNGMQSFGYVNASRCYVVDGVDDAQEFQVLMQAFDELGFTKDEVTWVLQLTSAILHLGNATFQSDGGEGSQITATGKQEMAWIARLLQIDAAKLEFALCHRSIEVRGQVTNIPLKHYDAQDSRDALSKSIYGELFDWLVDRINRTLTVSKAPWALIGLLDIFGFEIFENNSYEQLCINFTNEKLQQIFNRDTFKLEEALYTKEGIQFEHIKYVDNQPILDMIEGRNGGIMLMLDDLNRMPKSTDEGFVAKIDSNHKTSQFYIDSSTTRQGNKCFTIKHYAGDVVYNADGFLAKNKDLLFADLYDVMTNSKCQATAAMFPAMDKQRRAKYSLGTQFRKQLDTLMNILNQTQTHYIRCVKPNSHKAAKQFDSLLSLEQLRYSGVFEAVRIRKQGYPFRYSYDRFVERYKCVLLKGVRWTPLHGRTARDQTREILEGTGQDFSGVKFGATMALYRSEQHRLLELLRALALERVCAMIQAIARGFMARRFYAKVRAVEPAVIAAVRSRDIKQIDAALLQYSKLVGYFGSLVADIGAVQKAKRIKYALVAWENLAAEMDKVVRMDVVHDDLVFEALKNAVWKGETLLDEPGTEWHMQMYEYSKNVFEEERHRRLEPRLRQAMDLLERELMSEVYTDCKNLRYEDPRLHEIEKFVGLGEEDLLKMQYRKAKSLGMADRARKKEIDIREMFLDRNAAMFSFSQYARLRNAEEYSSQSMQFWKRETFARDMLVWQKYTIITSLTQLTDPTQAKLATRLHKSILGWCGDKPNPSPNNLAYEVVMAGVTGSDELRDEIYCQLMKQATNNPGPQSLSQTWKMMALCFQFFPPSTDFANFIHIFIRVNASPQLRSAYTQRLYQIEYDGVCNQALSVDGIPNLVANW